MEQTKKTSCKDEFYLKVSRLSGEIMQLGTLLTLSTEFFVKVEFSAHVEWMTVGIYEKYDDYTEKENGIESGFISLSIDEYRNDTPERKQKTIARLMRIKRMLINILKEKQIDYGKLDYTIQSVEYKQYVI